MKGCQSISIIMKYEHMLSRKIKKSLERNAFWGPCKVSFRDVIIPKCVTRKNGDQTVSIVPPI